MALGGVLRDMRFHAQQGDIDLQSRIAQQAQELQLSLQLFRHDVEDKDAERTDVLMCGAVARHHEDPFVQERLIGRELR